MSDGASNTLQAPTPILKKNLQLKLDKLPDVVGKALTGNWTDAAKDFFTAVGVAGDTPNELAFRLLWSGLIKTATSRTRTLRTLDNTHDLTKRITSAIAEAQDTLDYRLFEEPRKLKAVAAVTEALEAWLRDYGFEEQISTVIQGFERSFERSLFVLYAQDEAKYASLLKNFGKDNPFYESYKREIGRKKYHEWLEQQPNKPVLSDPSNPQLRQLYVEPRAYYEKYVKGGRARSHDEFEQRERYFVRLEEALDNWIESADENDAVRVISGDPGCGKSSFITMFAAKYAALDDIGVLVIPLHRIPYGYERNLANAIDEIVKNDDLLTENPIDTDTPSRWLIIFDGLDELEAHEDSANVANDFLRQMNRYILDKNTTRLRFQVLLSGRTIIVKSIGTFFRNREAVFEIIPYFVSEEHHLRRANDDVHDPLRLLEEDLRHLWWQKYGEAKDEPYTQLPEELSGENLQEITSQPLLSYLMAMSFERGEVEFSEETNLNLIYQDLLHAVFDREKSKQQSAVREFSLERDEFIEVFEEVALTVWHGNGRTATLQEIRQACQGMDERIVKAFDAAAGGGALRLLAAFYS